MLDYTTWEQVKVDGGLVMTEFPFQGVLVKNKQTGAYRWYFENLKSLSREVVSEAAAKLICQSRTMRV